MIRFKGEKQIPDHSGKDASLTLNQPSCEMLVMMMLKSYDNLRSNADGFRKKGAHELADILTAQADWVESVIKALRDGGTFNTNLYKTMEEMDTAMTVSTTIATKMMAEDPDLAETREHILGQLREIAEGNPEMLEEVRKFEEESLPSKGNGSKPGRRYH